MRHGALAAIAATVSVATVAAVIGTVALVSGSTSAASTAEPARSQTPTPASLASAARDRFGSSTSAKPFDRPAVLAGFVGPYRFVAHLDGLPGLMNLGAVVQGSVTDPTHFVLDFPDSTFITRYTRDGSSARAVVNGQTVAVQPGPGTAGAISPEDMLPAQILAQLVAMWETSLQPDTSSGTYVANAATLSGRARTEGILASGWQLSAKTDPSGRLTSLGFSGKSWSQSFAIDLVVLYG